MHSFVIGDRRVDVDSAELRVIASAGYRPGLVPEEQVATFGADPSTEPGVYITGGESHPTRWTRVDHVVAMPATDGSPLLRFRAVGGNKLPTAFLETARRTRRVLVIVGNADRRTVILY
ncbi:hypothetical protein [Pseudonocardia acaciae]|uniref:hypothetical protein n=1 Tax=Pseudonocardia acaciae TaxID=551276 RepID=UPI0012EE4648|nr:hypothetical protein [Pseudonocardia acaciae]